MDITSIPPTIFVALGVITAAILAGFFSFLNLVSSKENKISESRLNWIDGLRNEIAAYSSAIQELARLHSGGVYSRSESHDDETYNKLKREKYEKTKDTYAKAAENLTKIQLRLNQKHIKEDPTGHEARLMAAILKARADFNNAEYFEAFKCCGDISTTAAPLLKSTWDLVKNGEPGYVKIRETALKSIKTGMILIGVAFLALIVVTFTPSSTSSTSSTNLTIQNLTFDSERLQSSKDVKQIGSPAGDITDLAKASGIQDPASK